MKETASLNKVTIDYTPSQSLLCKFLSQKLSPVTFDAQKQLKARMYCIPNSRHEPVKDFYEFKEELGRFEC